MSHSVEPEILLILGDGRSGSTFIGNELARRLNGISLGELRNIWSRGFIENQLCGCGELTADCSFWMGIRRNFESEHYLVRDIEALRKSVDRYRYFVLWKTFGGLLKQLALRRLSYIERLQKLGACISTAYPGRIIVDTSKDPSHVDLMLEAFPNARVIHLVRRPEGVAYSNKKRKRRIEIVDRPVFMATHGVAFSAIRWMIINILCNVGFRGASKIFYEDVCNDPLLIEKIANNYKLDTNKHETPLYHFTGGNPSAYQSSSEKRWIIDDDWRLNLSFREKAIVKFLGSWLYARMRKKNYEGF